MIYFILFLAVVFCSYIGAWLLGIYEYHREGQLSRGWWLANPIIGFIAVVTVLAALTMFLLGLVIAFFGHSKNIFLATFISALFITNRFNKSIDTRAPFWKWAVTTLNGFRYMNEGPWLLKLGPLYIRDPHSHPMPSEWGFSSWHPFMLKKSPLISGNEIDNLF